IVSPSQRSAIRSCEINRYIPCCSAAIVDDNIGKALIFRPDEIRGRKLNFVCIDGNRVGLGQPVEEEISTRSFISIDRDAVSGARNRGKKDTAREERATGIIILGDQREASQVVSRVNSQESIAKNGTAVGIELGRSRGGRHPSVPDRMCSR